MAQSACQLWCKKYTYLCYGGRKTWIVSLQVHQQEINVSKECGEMYFVVSSTFYYIFYAREDGQLFTIDNHIKYFYQEVIRH